MDEYCLARRFNQSVDEMMDGEPADTGGTVPPEFTDLLHLASTLQEMDLSSEGGRQKRIWSQLQNHCRHNSTQINLKEVIMKNIFREHRPAQIVAAVAFTIMLGFALVFHGPLLAMADSAAANIVKIVKLGSHATVMQMSGQAPGNAPALSQDEKDRLDRGEAITKQLPDGTVTLSGKRGAGNEHQGEDASYSSLVEAQKAVRFQILAPKYLPPGYSFKEAGGYKGADQYINLYFSGSGKDIILMQRVMSQEAQLTYSTDGPIEEVDINGATGTYEAPGSLMWEKNGVEYALFCKGFGKDETLKIARSI